MSGLVTSSALQSRKWQLIGMMIFMCNIWLAGSMPLYLERFRSYLASKLTIYEEYF